MITPVLRVHDIDLSVAFYTRVLGFAGFGGLPGADGRTAYAEVYLGDARIMFSRRCASAPHASGVELYVELPESRDIERFYALLQARELYFLDGLHDELWGDRAFTIVDLDGNRLTFAQPIRYAVAVAALAVAHIA